MKPLTLCSNEEAMVAHRGQVRHRLLLIAPNQNRRRDQTTKKQPCQQKVLQSRERIRRRLCPKLKVRKAHTPTLRPLSRTQRVIQRRRRLRRWSSRKEKPNLRELGQTLRSKPVRKLTPKVAKNHQAQLRRWPMGELLPYPRHKRQQRRPKRSQIMRESPNLLTNQVHGAKRLRQALQRPPRKQEDEETHRSRRRQRTLNPPPLPRLRSPRATRSRP